MYMYHCIYAGHIHVHVKRSWEIVSYCPLCAFHNGVDMLIFQILITAGHADILVTFILVMPIHVCLKSLKGCWC